jgi:hypothetical protein
VGETLADAGILLPTARPATVAAAVARIREDTVLAHRLADAGRRRLADFGAHITRQRFVDVLAGVADAEQGVA